MKHRTGKQKAAVIEALDRLVLFVVILVLTVSKTNIRSLTLFRSTATWAKGAKPAVIESPSR